MTNLNLYFKRCTEHENKGDKHQVCFPEYGNEVFILSSVDKEKLYKVTVQHQTQTVLYCLLPKTAKSDNGANFTM